MTIEIDNELLRAVLSFAWELLLFLWLPMVVLTGVFQAARGRNGFLWALLALFFPVPAFIAACVMHDVRTYGGRSAEPGGNAARSSHATPARAGR